MHDMNGWREVDTPVYQVMQVSFYPSGFTTNAGILLFSLAQARN